MATPNPDLPGTGARPGRGPMLPDEENALEEQLDRVAEEKRRALADPGPGWMEWFCFSGSKWYVVVAYLIVLSWEISYLFPPLSVPFYEVVPVLAASVYAEVLLWQYLWRRPSFERRSRSTRPHPARRWIAPVEWGRWTPEGVAVRAGKKVIVADQGPDPREFL